MDATFIKYLKIFNPNTIMFCKAENRFNVNLYGQYLREEVLQGFVGIYILDGIQDGCQDGQNIMYAIYLLLLLLL